MTSPQTDRDQLTIWQCPRQNTALSSGAHLPVLGSVVSRADSAKRFRVSTVGDFRDAKLALGSLCITPLRLSLPAGLASRLAGHTQQL